jgi:hypothetical protein
MHIKRFLACTILTGNPDKSKAIVFLRLGHLYDCKNSARYTYVALATIGREEGGTNN